MAEQGVQNGVRWQSRVDDELRSLRKISDRHGNRLTAIEHGMSADIGHIKADLMDIKTALQASSATERAERHGWVVALTTHGAFPIILYLIGGVGTVLAFLVFGA